MKFKDFESEIVDIQSSSNRSLKKLTFNSNNIQANETSTAHSFCIYKNDDYYIVNGISKSFNFECMQSLYFREYDACFKLKTKDDEMRIIDLIKRYGILIDSINIAYDECDSDNSIIVINMLTSTQNVYMLDIHDNEENNLTLFSIYKFDADKLKTLERPSLTKKEYPICTFGVPLSEKSEVDPDEIINFGLSKCTRVIINENEKSNYLDSLLGNNYPWVSLQQLAISKC